MTVSNQAVQSGPYYPNGVTTVFPFSFRALADDEVRFVRVEPSGVETVISTALYDVTLLDEGGSVIFAAPLAVSALPHYVQSDPAFTQEISFENEGAFLPEVLTEALDRADVRDLYLLDEMKSAVKGQRGEVLGRLPIASVRRGLLAGFNPISGDLGIAPITGEGVLTITTGGLPVAVPVFNILATLGTTVIDDGMWGIGDPLTDDGPWG